ncbi:Formate hydrogenlyase subunit 5 [Fundidesulfovibrio magnetotacticus]|uniref:Formate hydrogenlyase subunit 5 n=1 Tax=Fundidesulfovibrio magnetotacticus TaxID=2730080 RepID=A0A6V8LUQ8_9BACT|nr:nickel-dependent hydrogenase large subunit [Fundidesulfovibrio magnetotacticus]GFK94690.1 Formate hydrogenlyase subunit 5 [Fundidesulfovibrio magnetotacticus]
MSETYTLPVGPLHVALEEPMYFDVRVEGETVRSVELSAGHVHRGMEALAMNRNWLQNITLTERVCSLCSNSHPTTYCMAVENLAGVVVPERAEYLRVIADEVKRIASHLFNVGIMAHLVGFDSLFMHAMEIREIMQDLKEGVYGNRMNLGALAIGGCRYDLDEETTAFMRAKLRELDPLLTELTRVYATDPLILKRTRGIGVLPMEEARRYEVVGPVARASGIAYDVRRKAPYAVYPHLDFEVQTDTAGDVHSRAMLRLREAAQSAVILEQCLENIPEGPICLPGAVFIPEGEAVARSEAPRGEVFYYVRSDGSDSPQRLKWRVPTYMNWEALQVMMAGCQVADIPLIVNSIDPCISCTER